MDATNKKTLSGFLVGLMVGAVLLTAVGPTAEATHNNTGNPDVYIDVRPTVNAVQTITIRNGSQDIVYDSVHTPTNPAGHKILWGTAYELQFVGVNTCSSCGATGYGYTFGGTGNVELINASTGSTLAGQSQPLSSVGPDGTGGVLKNATFFINTNTFPGPGLYQLRVGGTSTIVSNFVVWPKDDISVTVTTNPTPVVYTGSNVVVTVGTGVSGAFLSSNAPGFISGNPTTDSAGSLPFFSNLPMGAGNWKIFASLNTNTPTSATPTIGNQCIPGTTNCATFASATPFACTAVPCTSVPERLGNTTFSVAPSTLGVTGTAVSAFVGFQNTVTYNVTYPSTGNSILRTSPTEATVTEWNFSARDPNGFLQFVNTSMDSSTANALPTATAGFGTQTWRCQNSTMATAGTAPVLCSAMDLDPVTAGTQAPSTPTVAFDATTLRLSYTNGSVWLSGTYTFNLGLEADATTDDCSTLTLAACASHEFLASWTLSPATPSAVTLSSTSTTVNVPAPDPNPPTALSPVSAAIGTLNFPLVVSGSTVGEHPYCRLRSGFTTSVPAPTAGDCDPYGNTSTGAVTDTTHLRNVVGAEQNDGSPAGCAVTSGTAAASASTTHCFMDNISVRGAVLPGWKVVDYTPSSGLANIRMTPSANGTIFIDVAWKNVTTTLTVPVVNGANISASLANLTVDTTTTFTVSVKDANQNVQTSANVYLFPRIVDASTGVASAGTMSGTGSTFIAGTGQANAGQGGTYQYNVKPTAVRDLVVAAQIGSGSNINWSYWPVSVLPSQSLTTTLSANHTMAGLRTPLTINVTNSTGIGKTADANKFKLFFLTSTQKRDLDTNGSTQYFVKYPVASNAAQVIDTASAALAFLNYTQTSERDYYVWFCSHDTTTITDCSTATHDNRLAMPVFNVTRYNTAFDPTQIASSSDIQSGAVVKLTVTDRDGALANGTLRIKSGASGRDLVTSVSPAGASTDSGVAVTNGIVNITMTGSGTVGNVNFQFDPTEATGSQTATFADTKGNLSVVAGNLTFAPAKVPILQSTLVTVRLANFTGGGLPGRVIRLCSVSLNPNFPTTVPRLLDQDDSLTTTVETDQRTNCPAIGTTAEDGTTGIVVTPNGLTSIAVYINNSYTQRTIPVSAGALTVAVSPTSPQAGGSVTITVSQPGGAASVGARILVTKNGTSVLDATADGDGKATLANVSEGTYTVTGIRTGFDNGTATFTVGAAPPPPSQAKFELSNLVVPATVNVGQPVTVTVTVKNNGTGNGTATANLLVNNAQRDSQPVTLAAGGNTNVAFTFTPTVAGVYAVTVRIGDVSIEAKNLTVGTPPTVTPTATPTASPTPKVTPTVTATPTATATPPASPTPTATATPPATPTTTTTPRVPGFEVVALIAALGVAMLVLRRRS